MVSIIMPLYNHAAYVAEAIKSCLYQTNKDWELIIVDDGSTDSSKIVVDYFLKNDQRIKYFYKENGGPASAMNYGIEKSNGDIICFAASDDIQLKDKIQILTDSFKKKIDFLYTGYYHSNIHAQPWEEVHPKPLTLENIKKNNCMSGGAVACRKSVFEKIKFRDLQSNEDMAFAWDLYKLKLKYAVVDIPTFNYRLLPTGLSYSNREKVEEITQDIIKEIDDYEKTQNLGNKS
jgi:glycosyltransferase involved in cell wall biosynthesis